MAKFVEHSVVQLIPFGLLVTVPPPTGLTVRRRELTEPAPSEGLPGVVAAAVKVADTVWFSFIVTAHVADVEQPPPVQCVNVEPLAAVAVNVTIVPAA